MAYPQLNLEMRQPAPQASQTWPAPIGFDALHSEPYRPPQNDLYPSLDSTIPNENGPAEEYNGRINPVFDQRAPDTNADVKVDVSDDTNPTKPLQDHSNVSDQKSRFDPRTMMFFNDGVRRIDYILAYEEDDFGVDFDEKRLKKLSKKKEEKRECRGTFINNLVDDGIEVEREDKKDSQDGKTYFLKVHAPWEILTRYAELMNMKMPMKIEGEDDEDNVNDASNRCCQKTSGCFEFDKSLAPPENDDYTCAFRRDQADMFRIENPDTFFSNAERSRIAHEVLNRTRFGEDKLQVGVRKLLSSGVFSAAYPLHEGRYRSEHSFATHGADNIRHLLYETWARPACWYKFQPLNLIRRYYGEKIGIYFAWLGFYTTMLIPASIVGLIVFIYGCATVLKYVPGNEICDDPTISNITMCPICDLRCSYWRLKESCFYSRITYLFDNGATVFFAIFMSLWATLFLEFWKRKEKEIQYNWDVESFEDTEETIRPEYEAGVRHKRVNPVTQELEPYSPLYTRGTRIGVSFVVILFMICLVLCAVFAVITYRVFIVALLYVNSDEVFKPYARILTTITGACLSLITIMVLNKLYQAIAIGLTNFEQPRTETEFEDRLTFKMFLFQFVNYFSTIFYVAFFKGRFTGTPGHYDYSLTGYRGEECDMSGCMIGLCIQLIIIMVGKQALNNAKELIIPVVCKKIRAKKSKKKEVEDENAYTSWERDYDLSSMPDLGLFDEYLEMVIQFGFTTVFVAAFPLAPLLALINNIIEIRLDAYKFVTLWRRPLAARGQDIGVWFSILTGISYLAVLSNAFIIAYTSDFVPRMIYRFKGGRNFTLHGYVEYSLSEFDVQDFQSKSRPEVAMYEKDFGNVSSCRYQGFYTPPDDTKPYSYTLTYWHVFAARLAFVIVFEHFVFALKALIDWLIPDTPSEVRYEILRERHLTRQALTNLEAKRAKTVRRRKAGGNSSTGTSASSLVTTSL